jgi:hypothetical protein
MRAEALLASGCRGDLVAARRSLPADFA